MRAKTSLILFLALVAVGATTLAWQQWQELVTLRATALAGDERAALETRLEEFKKRNYELQAQLAALQLAKNTAESAAESATRASVSAKDKADAILAQLAAAANDPEGMSKRDEQFELLGAMADLPEFQKLLALQQRGKIDAKYAALFKRLRLNPEELSRLQTLLADKQSAFADSMIAAHGQGLSGKDARDLANAVARTTQKEIDGSIKDLLGTQRFNQYQNYERTLPQREAVDQLAQRLSYTSTPLTPRQQDQLVQTLATTAATPKPTAAARVAANPQKLKPAQPIAPLPGALAGLGIASAASAPITTAAVAQSQSFLVPQQTAALQRMQQEQQAQQTLNSVLGGKKPANPAKPPGK